MTTFTPNSFRPFRLGAHTLSARRASTGVDPYAARAVQELAEALRKPCWWPVPQAAAGRAKWAQDTRDLLTDPFGNAGQPGGPELEDVLAQDGRTPLINMVKRSLWSEQRSVNATAILGNEMLFHWLVAWAIYKEGLPDADAIREWLLDEAGGGVHHLYPLVVVLAALDYVEDKRVETGDAVAWKNYVDTGAPGTAFSFRSGEFEAGLKRFVDDYTIRRGPLEQIRLADDTLKLGIKPGERDYLVSYFEQAGIELTQDNREALVGSAILQQRNSSIGMLSMADSALAPLDFAVTYHTDTIGAAALNTTNVRCAAQLFYVMTLGDELGVFQAADLLVTRYLSLGRVDIRSPELLRDLQDYALNEEFRNGQGRILKRTSEEERRMFYRQVFDAGDAELVDGMVTNRDFAHLWNALMVETVRYIEKVERSERPEDLVSRSPIGRIMEDLQYNLSSHSSGMAKIMAPLMYQELDFVIERIFKSDEIVDQLALHNTGSYWRVVERILQEHQHRGVNVTALQKKARRGHEILTAVADFSESTVADDGAFSAFVSQVEEFIITSEELDAGPAPTAGAPTGPGLAGVGSYGDSRNADGRNGDGRNGDGGTDQGDWSF